MPADAVGRERQYITLLARGILVLVVLLDSGMLSTLPLSARGYQEWLPWILLGSLLVANVYVFFAIHRAPQKALIVQGIAGAYGAYVSFNLLWYIVRAAESGLTPPFVLSLVLAGALAVGQLLVTILLWRLRRLPAV